MTVLRAMLRGRSVTAPLVTALGAELATSAGWWRVLVPAVPGVLVVVAALAGTEQPWSVVLVALGVALTVLGLVAGTCWALARRLLTEVPANLLGVVDGSGSPSALTPWLARTIDEAAGRTGGPPLTFADLWGATDDDTKRACLRDRGLRGIDLEVMTTDLGRARPQRLPMPADEWFFRQDEFRRLFPGPVVDAMVAAVDPVERTGAAAREHDLLTRLAAATGHRRLPRADLPVVVAARLSLSFPVLRSVPCRCYRFDFSPAAPIEAMGRWRAWLAEHPEVDPGRGGARRRGGEPVPLSRCWISDGGITSNLPVHFFDTPLPTRPTFLVNLRRADPSSEGPAVSAGRGQPAGAGRAIGPTSATGRRHSAGSRRRSRGPCRTGWTAPDADARLPRPHRHDLPDRPGGRHEPADEPRADRQPRRAGAPGSRAAGGPVRRRRRRRMAQPPVGAPPLADGDAGTAVRSGERRVDRRTRQGSTHLQGDARPDGRPGAYPLRRGTALGAHPHRTGGRARRPVARTRRGPGGRSCTGRFTDREPRPRPVWRPQPEL